MKVIYVDLNNKYKFDLAITETVKHLKEGNVIVYPTDTLYGLGCDARNVKAVEKILKIKKRESGKPLSVMIRDIAMAKKIAFVDRQKEDIMKKLLPGPYTLILPGAKNMPETVTGRNNSIGIRIPDNPVTRRLCENFENPIITTSVNIASEVPINDPFKIVEIFKEQESQPYLILDCGKIKDAKPSIAVDLTQKSPQILRSGTRNLVEIKELLDKLK
jgi:L-threonylcarbamoyladenylate synthase